MRQEQALRALAEPRRQAILRLVRDTPLSAGKIGEHFNVSQQAVSQHLQVLTGAGLLCVRQEGRRRLYAVDPEGIATLERFLTDLWPAGLGRLKRAVETRRER